MKILTKNKIVESYHFPFTEALIFSILIWTAWGLAEAFYWNGISAIVDPGAAAPDRYLYLEAFFIYVAIAAFLATTVYIGMKIVLAIFHLHNTRSFRAYTLCGILSIFFAASLFFCLKRFVWMSFLSQQERYSIAGVLVGFAIFLVVLLYRYASGMEFRVRRSGTMMLSILVISILLSFVRFPIFSDRSTNSTADNHITGYEKTMGYYYFGPLLRPR